MTMCGVREDAGRGDRGFPQTSRPRLDGTGPASPRTPHTTLVIRKLQSNVAVSPAELIYQLRHEITAAEVAAAVRALASRGLTRYDNGLIRLGTEWQG